MDLTLGVRQERHLMRQRGAGARPIQGNFGFVFKAGSIPVSVPLQPPPTSQEPLNIVVGLSESVKDDVIVKNNAPIQVAAKDIVPVEEVDEHRVQESAPTKPKRKAPKKRKALFTKKKPAKSRATKINDVDLEPEAQDEPGALEVVEEHNDHDEEDELSFPKKSTTSARTKRLAKTKTQTMEPVEPPSKKRRVVNAEPVVVEEKKVGLEIAADDVSTKPVSRIKKRVTKEDDERKSPQSKTKLKRQTKPATVKPTSPDHHTDEVEVETSEPLPVKKRASRLTKKNTAKTEVPVVEDAKICQAASPTTKAPTLIKRKRGKNDTTLQEEPDQSAIEKAAVPLKKLVKKTSRARKDVVDDKPLVAQTVDKTLEAASSIENPPLKRRSVPRATQSQAEEEELWFKRGSGRKRKPLAEQQVNTSSPKKTSSSEESNLEVGDIKPHAARLKKAVSSKSEDVYFPGEEIEARKGAREPSKFEKPIKRSKKETTRKVTATTTTKDHAEYKESDLDIDLFAPIKSRAPSAMPAAISKTSATRSGPRKRLPLPRDDEQEEDVDFSGLLDGIAAIAAVAPSSGR